MKNLGLLIGFVARMFYWIELQRAEVVYVILDDKKVSLQELELIRMQKVQDRGFFKKKLLLKEVIDI